MTYRYQSWQSCKMYHFNLFAWYFKIKNKVRKNLNNCQTKVQRFSRTIKNVNYWVPDILNSEVMWLPLKLRAKSKQQGIKKAHHSPTFWFCSLAFPMYLLTKLLKAKLGRWVKISGLKGFDATMLPRNRAQVNVLGHHLLVVCIYLPGLTPSTSSAPGFWAVKISIFRHCLGNMLVNLRCQESRHWAMYIWSWL